MSNENGVESKEEYIERLLKDQAASEKKYKEILAITEKAFNLTIKALSDQRNAANDQCVQLTVRLANLTETEAELRSQLHAVAEIATQGNLKIASLLQEIERLRTINLGLGISVPVTEESVESE